MLVVSAGLSTQVFPQASAGASFHAAISNGKFQGMIWPATPSGRGVRPGKRVFQFVRPAGVIKKMRGHERQIDVATFLDRFAAIHRFEHGQLARFFLNQARDAIEIFPALASRHFAPGLVVSAPRRFHREINIARIAFRDLGQLFFRRRIDRIEIFAGLRRNEFAVDEKLIALLQLDVVVRFRRGRVTPAIAKTQMALGRRKCGAMIDRAITFNDDKLGTSGFFSRHAALISNRSNQRLHAKSASMVHCKMFGHGPQNP